MTWHLVTGEYPPHCGGVGDYTATLAQALANAGDEVHVWTPAAADGRSDGATVHRLPDAFGPASRAVLARAWRDKPGAVLLQYVPNALGARGANLPFCLWWSRLRLADMRVMFHEPYFYFTWTRPWSPGNALALVQRVMARALLRGAGVVYYSTDAWRGYLPHGDRGTTLPIASSLPAATDGAGVARMRAAALDGSGARALVGHFGTYGAHMARELSAVLPALIAREPALRLALLGEGGPAFLAGLAAAHPTVARSAWAPGRLDASDLTAALRACDLLIQPYPDGVTTRRTTAMAGLKHGVPTVTTSGDLTEDVWRDTRAVALAPAHDAEALAAAVGALLRDDTARAALGCRGAAVYAAHFSIEHTVAVLRDRPAS